MMITLEDLLQIELVAEKICRLLKTAGLQSLSACNRTLSQIAKNQMKSFGNVLFTIRSEHLCEEGIQVIKDWLSETIIYHSGASITLCRAVLDNSEKMVMLLSIVKLLKGVCKFRSLRFKGHGWGEKWVVDVLAQVHRELEFLELPQTPMCLGGQTSATPRMLAVDKPFESLKELKLHPLPDLDPQELVKAILRNAPRLSTVKGYIPTFWTQQLSFDQLKQVKFEAIQVDGYEFEAHSEIYNRWIDTQGPKLRKLRCCSDKGEPMDAGPSQLRRQLMLRLLESNKDTMEVLAIKLRWLIHYHLNDILPVCQRLKKLVLYIATNGLPHNSRHCENEDYVTRFDYTRYFPNMTTVDLRVERWNENIEPGIDIQAEQKICHPVTTLKFTFSGYHQDFPYFKGDWLFPRLEQTFPNVSSVCVGNLRSDSIQNRLVPLLTVWPKIESISFGKIAGDGPRACIDASLLGLSKESLRRLRKGTGCYDHRDSPSIMSKHELKKLRFEIIYYDCWDLAGQRSGIPDRFITSLAGELALSQMPGLTLEVHEFTDKRKVEDWYNMDHLKRFVIVSQVKAEYVGWPVKRSIKY